MADENRMITFNYARTTWDQFKKQTVPSSNECMTKSEIISYFNVDSSPLNPYANNQLIRRDKFLGITPFEFEFLDFIGGNINDVEFISNTKLAVIGSFQSYSGYGSSKQLVLINKNGQPDYTFDPTVFYTTNIKNGFDVNPRKIVYFKNANNLIITGQFTKYYNLTQRGIISVKLTGEKNSSFFNNGFDSYSSDMEISANSDYLFLNPSNNNINNYNNSGPPTILVFNINGQNIYSSNNYTNFPGIISTDTVLLTLRTESPNTSVVERSHFNLSSKITTYITTTENTSSKYFAYNPDNNYVIFVSYYTNLKFYIYDINGTLIRNFNYSNRNLYLYKFTINNYIILYNTEQIVILDLYGNLINTISNFTGQIFGVKKTPLNNIIVFGSITKYNNVNIPKIVIIDILGNIKSNYIIPA